MAHVHTHHTQEQVSLSEALWRGFRMRCPNCGAGKLFCGFLKVADHCPACGEELFHHRADDFPPYLVILVLGHIIVPTILLIETLYAPAPWLQLVIWVPLTLVSALALLQPTKGLVVGLQWQIGMDGFEPSKQRRLAKLAPQVPPQLA